MRKIGKQRLQPIKKSNSIEYQSTHFQFTTEDSGIYEKVLQSYLMLVGPESSWYRDFNTVQNMQTKLEL